ncbi:MAG: hypothetical protein CMG74_06370 [Candidatus Marinimicrobia bacterium]|nr:hypothetical protein [Candidatus Neomarinimicrobiota bacterium]
MIQIKRSLIILYTFSLLLGQSLSVLSDLDTTSGFIGDVFNWSISIENSGNQKIDFPDIIIDNDSISIRNKIPIQDNGLQSGVVFELIFWDTGQYQTPEYQINILNQSGQKEYSLNVPILEVQIKSMLLAENENTLRPLIGPVPVKGVINFKNILTWILLFGLFIAMIWTWKKRQLKNYVKLDHIILENPEERALNRLSQLNPKGFSKEFYIRLSHISREYVETKYFVRALEMTTAEIKENRNLFPFSDEKFDTWLKILQCSDLVKYAKETLDTNQIESDLNKIKFIIGKI